MRFTAVDQLWCVHGIRIIVCWYTRLIHSSVHIFGDVTGVTLRTRNFFLEDVHVMYRESAFGPLSDAGGEFLDVIEYFAPFGHLGQNLPLCVHNCGMVTAKCLADLGQ